MMMKLEEIPPLVARGETSRVKSFNSAEVIKYNNGIEKLNGCLILDVRMPGMIS